MKKKFSVFPQNLAYYNEGEIVGGWIDLPQSPEVIEKFLKEVVKVDDEHEEYEIADCEHVPFPYESFQWGSLEKLNYLAIIYNTLDEERKEAVAANIEYQGEEYYSIDELINICLQANEIAYYRYHFEGIEYNQECSAELKMGYTMAEENGLYQELDKLKVLDFFDFEKYGNSFYYDYELFENGYLINDYSLGLDHYSSEEIREKVEAILKNNSLEKEETQIEI